MKGFRKIIGITVMGLTLTGCIEEELRPPTIEKTIEKNFEVIAKTEYKIRAGSNFPANNRFNFSATKKGVYLIEGWRSVYRCNDELDKIVDYKVTELPFKKEIDFSCDTYRVEITYSDGSLIERSTIRFSVDNN